MISITYPTYIHWTSLPNEISYNILSYMDLWSLWAMVQTHPLQKLLYTARYQDLLLNALKTSLPRQFQMIASAILSLHHGEYSRKPHNEPPDDFDSWLEDDETPCAVKTLGNPFIALKDIAIIQQDIEAWTSAFIRSRCVRPSTAGVQSIALGQEDPVTSSELYRIQRALWRFWFLCQLACPKKPCTLRHQRHVAYMVFPFMRNLTAWELEELECLYYFLQDEYELTKIKSQVSLVSDQLPLIQRLLLMMGYMPSDAAPNSLDVESTRSGEEPLAKAAFGCRVACSTEVLTVWSDAPFDVHEKNAGYAFYNHSMYSLAGRASPLYLSEVVFSDTYYDRQAPILCSLKWRYCIWDRARLVRWGMMDNQVREGVDWMTRWSRGNSGGTLCIHRNCQGQLYQ